MNIKYVFVALCALSMNSVFGMQQERDWYKSVNRERGIQIEQKGKELEHLFREVKIQLLQYQRTGLKSAPSAIEALQGQMLRILAEVKILLAQCDASAPGFQDIKECVDELIEMYE